MKFINLFLTGVTANVIELLQDSKVNDNIEHIVILMMENRSFDSIFGRLSLKGINPDVNGLKGSEGNSIINGSSAMTFKVQPIFNLVSKFDPAHSVKQVTLQIYGNKSATNENIPTMNGFAQSAIEETSKPDNLGYPIEDAIREVMGYRDENTMPVTNALANEFGIIDNWFASVPGPTYPNRHFLHCATAKGLTNNKQTPFFGVDCKTTFRNLEDNQKQWAIYTDNPFTGTSTMLYKDMRSLFRVFKPKKFTKFDEDARNGRLPHYTYIDPNFLKNDNHPPNSLYEGEKLVQSIYESLRNSPKWNSTLFLITYDEHGGYYDHVAPPVNIPIPDDSIVTPKAGNFKFDRLGIRIPTIAISPWIPKGTVFRTNTKNRYLEHSSVSATLKKQFNLKSALTKRDEWALSFHDIVNHLDLPRLDCPLTMPLKPMQSKTRILNELDFLHYESNVV
ncbi:phosphoesterase [Globomyces pollinis-pini]|nr:phosphoesterase [Globomyces pollinis-pini]